MRADQGTPGVPTHIASIEREVFPTSAGYEEIRQGLTGRRPLPDLPLPVGGLPLRISRGPKQSTFGLGGAATMENSGGSAGCQVPRARGSAGATALAGIQVPDLVADVVSRDERGKFLLGVLAVGVEHSLDGIRVRSASPETYDEARYVQWTGPRKVSTKSFQTRRCGVWSRLVSDTSPCRAWVGRQDSNTTS